MNKKDLINDVMNRTGLSKEDSKKAVEEILSIIKDCLKNGEKVSLKDFGTFEVRKRAERNGINPQTQDKIKIPASQYPAFKPSENFRNNLADALNFADALNLKEKIQRMKNH